MMSMSEILFIGLIVLAFYTDVRYSIIPNRLTLSGCIAGVLVHGLQQGAQGLLYAVSGCLGGAFVVFLLYIIKAVGAGDVKLFGAIGAMSGLSFALYLLFYAILLAGIIGGMIVLTRKKFMYRLLQPLYMILYMASIGRLSRWMDYKASETAAPSTPQGMYRFPFMLAVAPAVIITKLHHVSGVM